MASLWLVGVLLEVLAGISGTVGKQLVSLSARQQGTPAARLLKVGGLCITTLVGPVFDAAAFAFAPQSIVAPLNGLDVCWNTLLAPFTLGEKLNVAHVAGTALVASGAALTAVFGPHGGDIETLDHVRAKFFRWRVLVYLIVVVVFCAACYQVLQLRPKGVGDKIRGLTLGACAGVIAGNMCFCTCTVTLLRKAIESGNWDAWAHPLPYLLALCTVCVALGNVPIISRGLSEYEAIFMVTLFEGCHIGVACVSGGLVLDEMDHIEGGPVKVALYWGCVLLICLGLYVLQTAAVRGIGPAAPDGGVGLAKRPGSVAVDRAYSVRLRAVASFLGDFDDPARVASFGMGGAEGSEARSSRLSSLGTELSGNCRL